MIDAHQAWADIQPRLEEAAQKEKDIRAGPWLGLPIFIGEFSAVPLTLRRYSILAAAGNAFVLGEDPGAADIVQFLWIVSPGFDPNNEKAKQAFIKKASSVPALKTIVAIREYISDAFFDAPKTGGSAGGKINNRPIESYLVHQFAAEYGWSADTTLDTPLAQLFQLRQLMLIANGKNVWDKPLQDSVKAQHLRDLKN